MEALDYELPYHFTLGVQMVFSPLKLIFLFNHAAVKRQQNKFQLCNSEEGASRLLIR